MIHISNEQFLQAIFGDDYLHAHVTDFHFDPSNIPQVESSRAWCGDYFHRYQFSDGANQYFCISTFNPDETGRARRRKVLYKKTHCVVLDDVREKLSEEAAQKLPRPSWILETSPGSFQWGYILSEPCTQASRIDNLNDGLISSELAPSGKDPGMRSITRIVRLPAGYNTKASKMVNGQPFKCQIRLWEPFNTVTLEQLAQPFGVDLDAPRRDLRVDGAAAIPDHPLVNIPDILQIKSILSDGKYEIRCPWVDEHTGAADNGAAIFTNDDGSLGFCCHHGSCEGRTGGDLLEYIEDQDPGFNDRLKDWQVNRQFTQIAQDHAAVPEVPATSAQKVSPLKSLQLAVANGNSQSLETQMLSDKFILKDIAILGHWTVFYAGPGTGKTLLTLWLLREAVSSGWIDGKNVFYCNCDDSYKGGVQKLKIAESTGFNMLLPNVNGFKPDSLLTTMSAMAEAGEANGVVIILDTLKKFTDLMDKRVASKFGTVARNFVSAGGTLICLAHVNKHKDADGKSIYSGTSDIRDDADCCYTIEMIGKEDGWPPGSTKYTVQFENNKARGDVAQTIAFQYTGARGAGYQALIDSVQRVDRSVVEAASRASELEEQKQSDAEAIEAITTAITNDRHGKTEIVEFVMQMTDIPRNRIRTVLKSYEGQLWFMSRSQHNICFYSLNLPPAPPVNNVVSFL